MEKVLKLYKYINGTTSEAFPSEKEQVIVSSFRYDAKRMGGAPTISCSVMHSSCLDNLWTDNVYASFNGERYFIKQVPTSSYGNTDTRFKYDIELVSERILLDNVYFYDVVSSSYADKPVSNSSNFSFFGTINEFASRLNQSLNYSKLDYKVVVDSGISSEPKLVSFQDQFFSNVLQEIFNVYELPYYFVGKTIHIGYTNNAITKTFKYGQSESLLSIQKQNANYKIVNRVTGVGSADNIPYYYPNDYESKSEVESHGGKWINPQPNLMPSIYRRTNGDERFYSAKNNTYISPETGTYYVFGNPYNGNNPKEHIVNFDYIKPTIEGITNGSGYRIDMFSEFAYDYNDNDETDEEGNYKHPYFFARLRRFDGSYGFNLFNHAIDEEEMVISMTSGSCGACEFIVGVDEGTNKNIIQVDDNGNLLRDENGNVKFGAPQDVQNDTINNEVWIALKKDIDTFGVIMPNASSNYRPSVNDTFVILHIDLPKSYIIAAEDKLEDELIKYMAMNNDEKFNFSIEFSRIFFAENPSILSQLNENARIQIEYDENRYELYISSFSYSMNNGSPLPEVRVELSDTLTISRNALQLAIDGVKQDIMSSVGSVDFLKQGLKYFLRKDVDDRSRGEVASDKGFEVGNFIEGMIGGQGAKVHIDKNGKTIIEVDKIYGREELVVPVITFNTIEVVRGDNANTFAYGVIKEVDTDRCIASLDLLVEEYGTLKEYDILRGVFHNINGGNDTETKEDANGFLQYSGFFTSYFTPYEILTNKAGEMSFRYSLQDGTTCHPCAGMKFFAYGNFVEKDRQSITYENRDYKRRLVKMDSWVINPTKNIAMQDGKLDNLNIGGFTMSGYGTFQTNSYFTGAMIEFTPDQLENLKGEDSYSVSLSSYEGIVKVDVEGNVTNGLTSEMNVVTGSMNVVTGDKNVVTTTFALKTTVQASRGSVPLFYSNEVVKGGYLMSITPIGCKAVIRNGSVVVTDIYDLVNCYVDITINCEGKYPIDKRYTITGVYDGQSSEVETIYSKEKEPKAPADVHPYEDDEVWNHEASEENIWMAMATKKNDEWTPWQVTRIKGFDAFEYKVMPETTSIGRTMTGSLSPNAIHLACCRIEQGKRTEVNATWRVQRWKSEAEGWVNTDYTYEGTSIDFVFPTSDSMDNGWKQYRFVAVPEEVEDTEAVATATILDEGKNGQIARYCGVFKEGKAYVWDEDYRDIVVYNGNAYQVKSFGSTVTESPEDNPNAWNEADKFDFVAMDTALISGANIAGFTFTVSEYRNGVPYGVLASANNDIVLDAATGKFSCKGASVDGDFNVGSIAFKTRSTQGSLEGYSLGLGGHLFALPTLEPNQNMELRVLYPSVDSRVPQGVLSVYVPEGSNASIVVPDESEAWAKFDTSVGLYPNILYTIFGYCDYKGYTQWYIGGSYGSTASVPIKTNVDKSVVAGSNNPVSGGAVYTALKNKIQKVNSEPSTYEEGVLYIVTKNG